MSFLSTFNEIADPWDSGPRPSYSQKGRRKFRSKKRHSKVNIGNKGVKASHRDLKFIREIRQEKIYCSSPGI